MTNHSLDFSWSMLQRQDLASRLFWGEFETLGCSYCSTVLHRAISWCESVTVHHMQRFVGNKYRDGCLRWNTRTVNLSGRLSLRACHPCWRKRGKLPIMLGYLQANRIKESSISTLVSHWRLQQSSPCQSTCKVSNGNDVFITLFREVEESNAHTIIVSQNLMLNCYPWITQNEIQ